MNLMVPYRKNAGAGIVLRKLLNYILLSGGLIFALPAPLFADLITYRNGQQLECILADQNRQSIFVKKDGKTITISKKDIRKIKFGVVKSEVEKSKAKEKKLKEMQARVTKAKKAGISSDRVENLMSLLEDEVLKESLEMAEEQKRRSELALSLTEELEGGEAREEERRRQERISAARGDKIFTSGPRNALWRSALIPGWGQYYNLRNTKAGALFSSSLLSAITYGAARSAWSSARSRLQSANDQALFLPHTGPVLPLAYINYQDAQKANSDMSTYGSVANGAAILMGVIYIYNLIDAYFLFGALPEELAQTAPSYSAPIIALYQTTKRDSIHTPVNYLTITWRF